MPRAAPWNILRLELTLTLSDVAGGALKEATIPLTSFACQYELGSIPQATATIPTGRDMATLRAATTAPLAGSPATVAEVRGRVVYRGGSDQAKAFGLPASGPFTLFHGYLAGVGLHRDNDGSALRLGLRHWLSDLDASSVYSRYSHPANPASLSLSALARADAAGARGKYAGAYDYGRNVVPANIQGDLWERALRPYLVRLCGVDGLEITQLGVASRPSDNTAAAAALGYIRSWPSLGLKPLVGASVAAQMQSQLLEALSDNARWASGTMWDVLAGALCPEYGFAIAPRVTDALAVPFLPTLATPYRTVGADEYLAVDVDGALPRPLRAVGLISGVQAATWIGGRPGAEVGAGGWYENDAMPKGMVLVARAPRWAELLGGLTAAQRDRAAGLGGRPIALAADPAAAGAPDAQLAGDLAAARSAAASVLDAMAEARYAHELDRHKQGFFAGPLRMDIAPGSIVALQPDGATWLSQGAPTPLHGMVARVAIEVDATRPAAGASFHLTHVRTDAENRAPGRSQEAHPYFAKAYAGAGLLADPAPEG